MIKSSLGLKVIVFRCILLTIDQIIFWHALLCERLLRQKSNKWQWIRSDDPSTLFSSSHHYIISIKITELPLLTISSSQCMTLSTSLFSPIVTIKTLCQHFPSPTKNRFVQHILNTFPRSSCIFVFVFVFALYSQLRPSSPPVHDPPVSRIQSSPVLSSEKFSC